MIETYHLSKLYKRGVYALRDLSLTIDKGEFMFLTGPSGAGKSTLLRLLLREDVPTDGQLKVSGRDISDLDFYLAFEHWRAAIIKEGIYRRHVGGQATADGGDEIGATVSLHLEEAMEILGAGA